MKHFIGMCALALALCSVPARADSYLSAFGGASVLNDFSGDGAHASFQAEPDTGFVGGVALGTDIDAVPGVKIEFEAAYRRSELQGTLVRCGNEEELGGSSGLFTAMFNVRYGVEVAGFHPYALAGAGYGARRIVLEPTPDNWTNTASAAEEQGFVWQVGGGVEYPIADGVNVGLGYAYVVGVSTDRVATFGGKDTFFEANGDIHEARVTLRVDL